MIEKTLYSFIICNGRAVAVRFRYRRKIYFVLNV